MPIRKSRPPTSHWPRMIVEYIGAHPDRPLRNHALARELGVPASESAEFRETVRRLIDDGRLMLGRGRTLKLPGKPGERVGTMRVASAGYGFVATPGLPDAHVPKSMLGDALDGDLVAIRLLKKARGDQGGIGEVTRIVKRGRKRWVGRVESEHGRAWVQPIGRTGAPRVSIDPHQLGRTRAGDWVVVEADSDQYTAARLRGAMIERLGDQGLTAPRLDAIMRHFDLPGEFPDVVQDAVSQVSAQLRPADAAGRLDLRDSTIFTIDPVDARDFDDAISIEQLRDGRTRLGVHIADVTHFVPAGGPVDLEAAHRGTSVYLPGRVVPMLPESLSNGLCSLQPGVDRLTQTVYITYDHEARVVATAFARSIIRSSARLTYEQASAALSKNDPTLPPEVSASLRGAEHLARAIQRRRRAQGMLTLTIPQIRIVLDSNGEAVDARPDDTSYSHTIIEMFMVEANEAVSARLADEGVAHLRRVHPSPDPEPLSRTLQKFGVRIAREGGRLSDREARSAIRTVLDETHGTPAEVAASLHLLRAMAPATYGTAALGHFALASRNYCHFTSPIRRYPDLINHRLLNMAVHGSHERGSLRRLPGEAELEAIALACNQAERQAQQAQRQSEASLLRLILRSRIGQEFDAIVVGVAPIGVFVQLRSLLAEGFVPLTVGGAGGWKLAEDQDAIHSSHAGMRLELGSLVRVRLLSVDDIREELRFELVVDASRTAARSPSRPVERTRTKVVRKGRRGRR